MTVHKGYGYNVYEHDDGTVTFKTIFEPWHLIADSLELAHERARQTFDWFIDRIAIMT